MRLLRALNEHGVKQSVYVPVRTSEELGKYVDENLTRVEYRFSHILKSYHKVLFHLKIRQSLADLISWKEMNEVDVIHGHFLFSDGAKALKLKERYGIPYIVSVRNADVNSFFKYMIHLRGLGVKIMMNAERVVFLNPKYKEYVFRKYIPQKYHAALEAKVVIIPNGVDDFWIQNRNEAKRELGKTIRLIYVGDYTPNKNIKAIIQASDKLSASGTQVELHLVGGGGENANQTSQAIAESGFKAVKEYGRITDHNKLIIRYREADILVMPSFNETFGLVYLEALSQGLPVIYSHNQGIDGYYPDGKIGYAVDPHNSDTIVKAIKDIVSDYENMSANALEECMDFQWSCVAETYMEIFKNMSAEIA
uniref:glycosyltransferase n=1 Tax=Roseivirga sp. TaxID=1964215 RepID=UPI004047B4CF